MGRPCGCRRLPRRLTALLRGRVRPLAVAVSGPQGPVSWGVSASC